MAFVNDDRGRLDLRQSGHGRFDLTQFNAKTANFDLLIDPTQKNQVAVWEPADQITGAVKFLFNIDPQMARQVNKFFRC